MGNKKRRKPSVSIRLLRKRQGRNAHKKARDVIAKSVVADGDDPSSIDFLQNSLADPELAVGAEGHSSMKPPEKSLTDPELAAADHSSMKSPEKSLADPELAVAADDHSSIKSPEKSLADPEQAVAADDHSSIKSPEKSLADPELAAADHSSMKSPEKSLADPELAVAADDHSSIKSPEKSLADPELPTPADDHCFVISPEKPSANPEFETSTRRIVDVQKFFDQLKQVSSHGPLSCGLEAVDIISETRNGLLSQFKLKCAMCNETFTIYNDLNTELDLNTSTVAGTVSIGCGYTQLTDLTAAIGVPRMTKQVFSKRLDVIHKVWEAQLLKSMSDAAEEERRLAIEENRLNPNGIPIIDVIADGCYGKRSYKKNYSSLSGAAAIIGRRTNKILYLAIKNKYCCICSQAEKKNIEVKDHVCYKNFTGASTGMESEILVEGFKKSIDMHNLIYGRLISDGDANTYAKILQTRPYDNYTVEKIECRNHLLRNMCNKLAAISTDTRFCLKYRKHMNNKRILTIRKIVKKAIAQYKNTNNITSLHRDIMAASEHAFGRHSKCKEYFCTKSSDEPEIIEKEMFSNSIWERITLIMTQLAAHARSLILDVDSNAVERFHSIVAKFVGGKRVNFSQRYQYAMRCNAAALSFNSRAPLLTLHRAIVQRTPRNEGKKNEERKEKSRNLAKKYLRKKRRLLQKQNSKDYGEDCSKPDIEPDILNISKTYFLENLKKNQDERDRIARETILQSGCSEWLELRRNILTASNFGRVIKRRMDISCQNMVKDILYKKSIEHVASIQHGRKHEQVALDQLSRQESIEIHKCGLFIDQDIPYLGASPDGVVDENMIVEIKCPASTYKIGLEKAIESKKFTLYKKNRNGQLELNKEHNYYYQIQGQLRVTKRDKCLLGIWSGEEIPIKTEIILRDDEFWSKKMEEKLKNFYIDCLLPELIDPRYTRKMPIRDPVYITEAIARKEAKKKLDKAKSTTRCPDQPTTTPAISTAICSDRSNTSTGMLIEHSAKVQKRAKKRALSTTICPDQPTNSTGTNTNKHVTCKKKKK